MRRREPAAVRFGDALSRRRASYEALARALVRAERPAGAVFEAVAPAHVPVAVVRPATLAGGAPDTVPIAEIPPAPTPPARASSAVGLLRPVGAPPEGGAVAPPLPSDLSGALGPDGWLAVQTFWVGGPGGSLWTARRFRLAVREPAELGLRFEAVGERVAEEWSVVTGVASRAERAGWPARRAWRRRSTGGIPGAAWLRLPAERLVATAEATGLSPAPDEAPAAGHTVVFGTSGAGKTTYLAQLGARAIERGDRVVAIDLHGDLAPAVVARLGAPALARLVAVDAEARPVAGIAALSGAGADDRAAGTLVAAVKRLSADGQDVYWGFRLERIFDSMVRLVQESGGSLLDLYDLLTSPERRDVARLATRRPELAAFLDELAPIVRRTPDYLWPAATRIAKVALVPALAELLAPPDGGLPVESLLASGRSLLVRLPFARLGPEAAQLAATFVLARTFLGLAARPPREGETVRLVLDEAHAFSPRLLAEVLAESRKFGLRVVLATQYPDRLAGEVRAAAAGAAGRYVVFRVPPASAPEVGRWIGLPPDVATRVLSGLPPGRGLVLDPELGGLRAIAPAPGRAGAPPAWTAAVDRTRGEFLPSRRPEPTLGNRDPALERLLLAVLAGEAAGAPLADGEVVPVAFRAPGVPLDAAVLADRWSAPGTAPLLDRSDGRCRLSAAGERWLGLGAPTGASRESAEHRRLLLAAFRIFARNGARLEILRQGRFDSTLPDARYRQIGETTGPPTELARAVDAARRTWAWRYFGGRDVEVEAEVTGAVRPERIRRGWAKARARDAFVLFVVGDPAHARRVRGTLDRSRVPRSRARVWAVPAARTSK